MRHKLLKAMMNLQLFAEGGDGGTEEPEKGGSGGDGNEESEDEEEQEEEHFTQKDIDEAVKKALAKEKRKWQREQKKATSKKASGASQAEEEDSEEDTRVQKAEERASELELKWTCLEHDVKKDCVDDVLALAKVHVEKDDSLDIEDAIDKVLEKYPQFKDGGEDEDDEEGGEEEGPKKSWGQRHSKGTKSKKTVDDEIRERLFGK